MIRLSRCAICGRNHEPERVERSKGFLRYGVTCYCHIAVFARTRDGADRKWNRSVERQSRKLARSRKREKHRSALRWKTVRTDPVPCAFCGGSSRMRSANYGTYVLYHRECILCKVTGPEAVVMEDATLVWNERMGREKEIMAQIEK